MSCMNGFPDSSTSKTTFSLDFLLLLMYFVELFLVALHTFIRFSSRRSWAFVTPSLQNWTVSPFLPGCISLYTPLPSLIFMLEVYEEHLAHSCRPPYTFAWYPACQDGPPILSIEEVILENQWGVSWILLFPKTITHEVLPSWSLYRPRSACLKSGVRIMLFVFFLPLRILNLQYPLVK